MSKSRKRSKSKRPIPAGLCVLHHCDNPPCCNPTHLFLGTMTDNNADMDAKGRRNRTGLRLFPEGERHPLAKLTNEQARIIRARAQTERYEDVARDFGVTADFVGRIVRGRGYRCA